MPECYFSRAVVVVVSITTTVVVVFVIVVVVTTTGRPSGWRLMAQLRRRELPVKRTESFGRLTFFITLSIYHF